MSAQSEAADGCATACRALSSMRRAATHLCELAGDEDAPSLRGKVDLVYIDPPYYTQGRKLYRHHYADADHAALATYITSQGYPWLVSYDDHPRIRELYASKQMQPIYLDYKVKSSRTAQELVISNLVIPPPVYVGSLDLVHSVAQVE